MRNQTQYNNDLFNLFSRNFVNLEKSRGPETKTTTKSPSKAKHVLKTLKAKNAKRVLAKLKVTTATKSTNRPKTKPKPKPNPYTARRLNIWTKNPLVIFPLKAVNKIIKSKNPLREIGMYLTNGKYFGKRTFAAEEKDLKIQATKAVKEFQKSYGLKATGRTDELTLELLFQDVKKTRAKRKSRLHIAE